MFIKIYFSSEEMQSVLLRCLESQPITSRELEVNFSHLKTDIEQILLSLEFREIYYLRWK